MPRIVYLSWPASEISGGIKAAFQHVELLVEGGFEAFISTPDGAPPTWFESPARVMPLDYIRDDDILVFPENHHGLLDRFARSAHLKMVFCQNPHLVYRGLNGHASYADLGISHILCPSHTVLHYCRRRFPGMSLGYTPYYIDHTRFLHRPDKALQIAVMPRKRMVEFGAIVDLFGALYPAFRHVPWAYLHKATESEVAQTLAGSAVYLSLARLEAHGMAALEAMACGCVVAGFNGVVGGSDTATARNGFWAAEDDVQACTDQLARAVQLALDRGPVWEEMVAESRRTAWDYRRDEAARRLTDFWRLTLAQR